MKDPSQLVCLVDDDPSVRKGLARLLRSAGHRVEVFESAADFLARELPPGPVCLVLDVQMPGLTGLDLQAALAERGRDEQIVFITAHADVPMSVRAMKRGAVDFLPKPFPEDALFEAVARALARSGKRQARRAGRAEARARIDTLTPREFEVLLGVAAGQLNKQIAHDLGAAEKTIKIHRARVMEKLRVPSVADLVRLVQRAGIQPGP